jgi:hypothetical protein
MRPKHIQKIWVRNRYDPFEILVAWQSWHLGSCDSPQTTSELEEFWILNSICIAPRSLTHTEPHRTTQNHALVDVVSKCASGIAPLEMFEIWWNLNLRGSQPQHCHNNLDPSTRFQRNVCAHKVFFPQSYWADIGSHVLTGCGKIKLGVAGTIEKINGTS